MADVTFTKIDDKAPPPTGGEVTFEKIPPAASPPSSPLESMVSTLVPAYPAAKGFAEELLLPANRPAPPKDFPGLMQATGATVAQLGRGAVEPIISMGRRALGGGEKGENPLRPLKEDEIMSIAAMVMSPVPKAAGGAPMIALTDADRAAQAAVRAAKPQIEAAIPKTTMKAAEKVSKSLGSGAAPGATDIFDEFSAAQKAGQPVVLADVASPEIKNLIGTIYRQGGAAAKHIKDFLKAREAGATERVENLINTELSDLSMRNTAKKLSASRSSEGRPLWDKAMAGGSLAPLETQFGKELDIASRSVVEAQRKVAEANSMVTATAGREATAGNVYSSSAANEGRTAANAAAQEAKTQLERATAERDAIRERFQQAQADGTANAPGAVWSPSLQRFLDQPEIQRGLARGYAIERRRAVGRGEPFNPKEYAVIGEDAAGEPIVGQVPNMRLLAVAKEGLDSLIESPKMKDKLTGRPNKTGQSYIDLRNGYRDELVRLNPDYKVALEKWSGDSASIGALKDGRRIFDDGRFTVEEIPEHLASLPEGDRQFFILGVSDALKTRLLKKVDSSDKGSIVNTEDARRRLRPLFQSPEHADAFLDALERERTMKGTGTQTYGNALTAERVASDKRGVDTSFGMMEAARHLYHRNFPAAANAAWRTIKRNQGQPDHALNEAIAKILIDPKVAMHVKQGNAAVSPWAIPQPPP